MTRLQEIKERCEKATPGPWELNEKDDYWDIRAGKEPVVSCGMEGEVTIGIEDAKFVANSREDILWLLSQLEQGHQLHEADNRRIRELEGKLEKAIEMGCDAHEEACSVCKFLEQMK